MDEDYVSDERRAWLAIRDALRDSSSRVRGMTLLRLARGMNRGWQSRETADGARDDLYDTQMTRYAIVADELVAKFTDEERLWLRLIGRVPDWYLGAVKAGAKRDTVARWSRSKTSDA